MVNADKIKIKVGGQPFDFMITPYGIMLAEEQGINVLEIFQQIETASKTEGSATKQLGLLAKIIWVGVLPFHETVTLKDIQMLITFNDFSELAPAISKSMQRLVKGAESEPVQGKKKRAIQK